MSLLLYNYFLLFFINLYSEKMRDTFSIPKHHCALKQQDPNMARLHTNDTKQHLW